MQLPPPTGKYTQQNSYSISHQKQLLLHSHCVQSPANHCTQQVTDEIRDLLCSIPQGGSLNMGIPPALLCKISTPPTVNLQKMGGRGCTEDVKFKSYKRQFIVKLQQPLARNLEYSIYHALFYIQHCFFEVHSISSIPPKLKLDKNKSLVPVSCDQENRGKYFVFNKKFRVSL